MLKAIDSARAAGKNTAEVEAVIKKSLRAAFPDASRENAEATAGTLAGSRFSVWERDTISHYICRLAYCRRDDLRKWLLANEVTLFEARLRAHGVTEVCGACGVCTPCVPRVCPVCAPCCAPCVWRVSFGLFVCLVVG